MNRNWKVVAAIGLLLLGISAGCSSEKGADSPAPTSLAPTVKPTDLTPFVVTTAEGDTYGYRDATGRVAIEPRFRMADDFSESGLASVVDDSGWVYINVEGQVVVRPLVVDNGPDAFSDGLARTDMAGRIGYFDESGKIVIEPRFDHAFPFSEGLAAVCNGCISQKDGEHSTVTGGRWGYINTKGEQVIPMNFDQAGPFEGGRASVNEGGSWKTIGKDGRPLP